MPLPFKLPTSRLKRVGAALAIALLSGSGLALAGDFPKKPITLVVPFAPGGGLDVTARIVAEKLRDQLGEPVVILNRPGAGSALGARFVSNAAPDGYTLFVTSGSAFGYMHLLVANFDLRVDDFVPVATLASNPSVVAASTSLPVKSLKELVDYAQSRPGVVSFCTTGTNGMNHLQLEMLRQEVKHKTGKELSIAPVPYNGLAPALVALKSHEVQACMLPYTALLKNVQGKDLRILAVQRAQRLPFLPDVPTTGEQGFPDLDSNEAYVVVVAPKGTPPDIVGKLQDALHEAMQDPAVKQKLSALDVLPTFMDSRDTRKWLVEDTKKFEGVIHAAGLSPIN